MILLLVLAADAGSAAIAGEDERFGRFGGATGRLVLAGVWVGLAFQAKMIEAWMVLPALGLAYLLAGPGPATRRAGQLVIGGVVAGLVSVSWMTAVSLVPAADRPYVDGSHDDSTFVQVFSYNGFLRFGDQSPQQLLAGTLRPDTGPPTAVTGPPAPATAPPAPATTPPTPATAPPSPATGPPPTRATAPDRLLRGDLGRDTGWLIPAAAAVALWGWPAGGGSPAATRCGPASCCGAPGW
jgi:4-amino-4-deoxy-L-arabinose transferase-like glycosyltransferase